jgi:hypothetical protein
VIGTGGWTQEFTFLKIAPTLIWHSNDRPPVFQGQILGVALKEDLGKETFIQDSPKRELSEGVSTPSTPSTRNSIEPEADSHTYNVTRNPNPHGSQNDFRAAPSDVETSDNCGIDSDNVFTGTEDSQIAPANTVEGNSPSPSAPGERFLIWLRRSIGTRKLIVNDAKALVHTVDGTAFLVTPRIFQRFLQEFPVIRLQPRNDDRPPWMTVQRSFERLARHRKQPGGLNIWTCHVTGPRKARRVNGYLLIEGKDIFTDIPPDNPYLQLSADPPPASE